MTQNAMQQSHVHVSFKKASKDTNYPAVQRRKNRLRGKIVAISPYDPSDFEVLVIETLETNPQRHSVAYSLEDQPELCLTGGMVIECTLTGLKNVTPQRMGQTLPTQFVMNVEEMSGKIIDTHIVFWERELADAKIDRKVEGIFGCP